MDDNNANAKAVLAMKDALETKGDIYGLHPRTEKLILDAMNGLEAQATEMKPKMRAIELRPAAVAPSIVLVPSAAMTAAGRDALLSCADDLFGNGSAGFHRAEWLADEVYRAMMAVALAAADAT